MSKCNQCHMDYDLEEVQKDLEIPQIMEEEQICFTCAFWKWQKKLDDSRPSEGILPIVTQESYKTVSSSENRQVHYCLTLGTNNLIRTKSDIKEIFRNITTGIITLEGYLFPYTLYSKSGGLTHQGEIPINYRNFDTNALFIQGSELLELLNRADLYAEPVPRWIAEGNLSSEWKIVRVPEHIVRRNLTR